MQTLELTGGRTGEDVDFLPLDLPPILLKDVPEPGNLCLLSSPARHADGREISHVARHDHVALGPFTPEELVGALMVTGRRVKVTSKFLRSMIALEEVSAGLASGEIAADVEALVAQHGAWFTIEVLGKADLPVPEDLWDRYRRELSEVTT